MRFLKIWGPRGILCIRGEKEHASKRASIIASDNVTSKAKCATRGQQGSLTAKRKCLHFEASVQCDRGTGAHGVRKGGEAALFEPDVVSRHIKKAQHIMLRVFKNKGFLRDTVYSWDTRACSA